MYLLLEYKYATNCKNMYITNMYNLRLLYFFVYNNNNKKYITINKHPSPGSTMHLGTNVNLSSKLKNKLEKSINI